MTSTGGTRSQAPVRADDLVVRYGAVTALDASSFELENGSATALIGANGSGKTTLLHAIAGVVSPTSGAMDNRRADATTLVTQQPHHHRWMPLTVREVVRMGRYRQRGLVGRFRQSDREAVDEAVERTEVGDLLDRAFGELSGGQQQRVRIAQALTARPAVLLLDEPITGLDPPSQERILAIIDTERRRDTTIVFSTHHLDEARHADNVLVLGGSVLACGPPAETLQPAVLARAFHGRVLLLDEMMLVDDHGHDQEVTG